MKKTGILNAELAGELTKLRHLDRLVICDAGFPIPKGAASVEYMIFDFMKEYNTEYYEELQNILINQKSSEVSMEDFIEASKEAKLFIRTGELLPASNILLVSASGVEQACKAFDVSFDTVL